MGDVEPVIFMAVLIKAVIRLNRHIAKPDSNPIAQYAFNNGAIKKNKYFLINTKS